MKKNKHLLKLAETTDKEVGWGVDYTYTQLLNLKNALLNQSFVAGIGNIYSDEILFRTKIHPKTKINSLNESKVKELFANIKEVLQVGIEKKGDLNTYPDHFLIPHRIKDDHCPVCKYEIKRIEISGRHGFFCPNCQKE